MDCSPPDSSVRGISQARTLEQIAISSARGSSQPRSPALQADSLPSEPPGKLLLLPMSCPNLTQFLQSLGTPPGSLPGSHLHTGRIPSEFLAERTRACAGCVCAPWSDKPSTTSSHIPLESTLQGEPPSHALHPSWPSPQASGMKCTTMLGARSGRSHASLVINGWHLQM